MSRSYKKIPIVKDTCEKQKYNKPFRRANKVRLQQGFTLLLLNEVVNQHTVSDWKQYKYNDKKAFRK